MRTAPKPLGFGEDAPRYINPAQSAEVLNALFPNLWSPAPIDDYTAHLTTQGWGLIPPGYSSEDAEEEGGGEEAGSDGE